MQLDRQAKLVDPREIRENPENPRLIFRQEELEELQASIALQGVLVPLSVFVDDGHYVLLDGERRWRCAVKLSLGRVPVLVQPKPERLQNIMMMFAIHNARKAWDPLPTAYKLRDLEKEFNQREGRVPSEAELAQLASTDRGEIRRLRTLLALPADYRRDLMKELEKPRSEQVLTVDHVLETTKGVASLVKRGIVAPGEREPLRRAIINKFRNKTETNTVAPRQLARIARAVDRNEISLSLAKRVVRRLAEDPKFTIEAAFKGSVEHIDFEHNLEQQVRRVEQYLRQHIERDYPTGASLRQAIVQLRSSIDQFLRR
jgi:ParB family transcriptional regulator, chromosome partitioning protein